MTTTNTQVPAIALRDGTTIPQLGFGTLAVQPDRTSTPANVEITAKTVGHALRAGYRHIDTAQAYGTEAGVGVAIATSGIPREELYLTSKLANANHGADDVRRSFDRTLTDLRVEQLDLFLIHWPLPSLYGGDYVSTWKAIAEFITQGRLRSAGVSNFQPAHLERIIGETGIVPVVNQFELHPYFANTNAVAATREHGIAVQAHSPLGHNGEPLNDEAIARIAAAHDKTPGQVILRWHVQHGHVAIPKSAQPQRMNDNISVFDFALTDAEVGSIDALDKGASGRVGPHPDTYEGV